MQFKDVTPIIKAIIEERDKIPMMINTERYIPNWQPNHHGNAMRGGIRKALRIIEQAPAVEVALVVHGKWLTTSDDPDRLICSRCGRRFDMYFFDQKDMPYCLCGAKMDGGK